MEEKIYEFSKEEIDMTNDDSIFANPCQALAMAYVPMQMWNKTYDPEVGICRGTIFPELDLPFIGEEALSCGKQCHE